MECLLLLPKRAPQESQDRVNQILQGVAGRSLDEDLSRQSRLKLEMDRLINYGIAYCYLCIVFICGFIFFFPQFPVISPLRSRALGSAFARCLSRGVSVTYCPDRSGLCAKITRASAACVPSAASHRLTLAYGGLAHYRFSR